MTDQPTTEPTTGSVALAEVEPTAGEQLLAELAEDESPIPPKDPGMHAAGCHLSAIALHVPAGLWTSLNIHSVAAAVDIEITAQDAVAAREIAERLPWSGGRAIRAEEPASDETQGTHRLWTGVLWGMRVRVAGLEPLGGAR